jgi:hypothetical protein
VPQRRRFGQRRKQVIRVTTWIMVVAMAVTAFAYILAFTGH